VFPDDASPGDALKPDVECSCCHKSLMEKMVKSSRGDLSHKVQVEDAGLDDCALCHVLEPGKHPC